MFEARKWVATALIAASMTSAGWSQVPFKNVTIPVPIQGAPPLMLNVNPTTPAPGYQRPAQKPFDFFGLLPPAVSGTCAQITQSYVAVTDSHNQFKVFTYRPGYVPPPDIVAGRPIEVTYKMLNNGLLQVISMKASGDQKFTVTGAPIPNQPSVGNNNLPTSQGVPNINVKPANGTPQN